MFGRMNLPWAPVKTLKEVWTDPQVVANQYITSYVHPVFGPKKTVGYPVHLSGAGPIKDCAAPELGQHTEEVLLGFGYTWEDINRLKDEKVIL